MGKIMFLIILFVFITTISPQENQQRSFISDFKVNTEKYGPQNDFQTNPAISCNKSGDFVIVWEDRRNRIDSNDIYAQLYSESGKPIGANIKVNQNNNDNNSAKAIVNYDGSFTILWREDRNSIWAQRCDNKGTKIGDNIVLQKYDGSFPLREYSVSSDEYGNFIIVWHYYNDGYDYIYAQKYGIDCNEIGNKLRVDDHDFNPFYTENPEVCLGKNGNFLIVWIEKTEWTSPTHISAKLFNKNGMAVSEKIEININYSIRDPISIHKDNSGKFAIKWNTLDLDKSVWNTYVQFISDNGEKIGESLWVNEENNVVSNGYQSVFLFAEDGSSIVFWTQPKYKGINTLNFQRFSAWGNKIGDIVKVDLGYKSLKLWGQLKYCQLKPEMIVAVWQYSEYGNQNIYAQKFSILDTTNFPMIKVNDDLDYSAQNSPSITASSNGNFKIVWADNRNKIISDASFDNYDIFLQKFDSLGNRITDNLLVNNYSIEADQKEPVIAETQNGNFMISWIDYRNSKDKNFPKGSIYAQFYSKDGSKVDTNFIVSKSSNNAKTLIIGANYNKFVIVWSENLEEYDVVKAQIFSDLGFPIGETFIVNESNRLILYEKPSIQFSPNGDFIISWSNMIGFLKVNGQYFDSNGNKIGGVFQINTDITINKRHESQASNDPLDLMVVTWKNIKFSPFHIYAQMYSKNGITIGPNFRVDNFVEHWNPQAPEVSCDQEGNFIIYWSVIYNGQNNFYAQLYNYNGEKLGEHFRINKDLSKKIESTKSKLINGKLYSVWNDIYDYDQKGDVWANVLNFTDLITNVKDDFSISPQFYLYQNYPNPFNSTTIIKYTLPSVTNENHSSVQLIVYDVLGRKIKTLINENQKSGSYEIIFNTSELSSGIYYYQLKTDSFIQSKKMILLK